MESLPVEICLNIFCFLDYHNLAIAQQVCRKWKVLAVDNNLWSSLFRERWGGDHVVFYAPVGSKSWKDVYEGLKITREGGNYYLVHQGEIQRYLGSRRQRKTTAGYTLNTIREFNGEGLKEKQSCRGILDKILFFIGDLEGASIEAKCGRVL
ncbi:uncharacterized protein LOC122310324 [Carya illinoinensis]|uniref:F-box protein n=1 Tax=Carya illinoinensis TaxID=32201 RepID=A0A8T1QL51_CARIL|nr:uncharacterized protein LOC122310324 [Carya illinoinensis]KAG6655226.1 hypothetical protein CIPAW_05G200900 [Carya illinoinensis]